MWFDKLLYPFKVVVAWIMVRVHDVLVFLGMNDGPGLAWVLSIVGLTIIVRILIFPLFFKQIKSQRGMQILQPELKKIQDKYKNRKDPASRQRMSEEMTALYREHGTTPFSSCLPVLAQMPVFFALYRVLASTSLIAAGTYMYDHIGPLNAANSTDIEASSVFGAPLSVTFMTAPSLQVKVIIVIFILIMGFSQFYTMRQLTMKNMPESAKDPSNPMMRTQTTMMYMMPVFLAVTGLFFQVGLVIYWLTTNLWTLGQQMWTISRMPTMGSDSYKKLMGKRRATYVESIRPIYEDYDAKVAQLDKDDEEGRAALIEQTLRSVKAKAKRVKVPTKFPETVSAAEQLGAYRELAYSEWDMIPDSHWLRRFSVKKKAQTERVQPERLTKRERQARQEAQRRQEARKAERERQMRNAGGLTPEEIERRREERRAEKRRARQNKKK